jgi:hypothetical protein
MSFGNSSKDTVHVIMLQEMITQLQSSFSITRDEPNHIKRYHVPSNVILPGVITTNSARSKPDHLLPPTPVSYMYSPLEHRCISYSDSFAMSTTNSISKQTCINPEYVHGSISLPSTANCDRSQRHKNEELQTERARLNTASL